MFSHSSFSKHIGLIGGIGSKQGLHFLQHSIGLIGGISSKHISGGLMSLKQGLQGLQGPHSISHVQTRSPHLLHFDLFFSHRHDLKLHLPHLRLLFEKALDSSPLPKNSLFKKSFSSSSP
jgi:hypothetical protein